MTNAFRLVTGNYKDTKDFWSKLTTHSSSPYFQSATWQEVWADMLELKSISPKFTLITDNVQVKLGSSYHIHDKRFSGFIRIRTAYLNATGIQAFDVICQEKCQPIVLAENNIDSLKLFFQDLIIEQKVDKIVINSVPANILSILNESCLECGLRIVEEKKCPNYFVDLEQVRNSGQTYTSILNHRARSSIKRSAREYREKYGELTISYADSIEQAKEWLFELAELNISRLNEKEIYSSFKAPFLLEFHNALIEKAFPRGEIFSLKVKAGSCLIGIIYGFLYKDVVYIYQTGFVFEQNSKLSPGLVAHHLVIEELLKSKIKKYDFLAGEYQYKRTLSNRKDELVWISISKPGILLNLEQKLKAIKRKLHRAAAN